jgi:hypothetical protein
VWVGVKEEGNCREDGEVHGGREEWREEEGGGGRRGDR